jgi:IS5 family transposase
VRVDALGNPTGFYLTGGEAHDLVGADELLPDMEADTLIADKAYDADERVIGPLTSAGKKVVIPSKANRKNKRKLDRHCLRGPSSDRELLRQAQAISRNRDPLRQDSAQLPRRRAPGGQRHLACLIDDTP